MSTKFVPDLKQKLQQIWLFLNQLEMTLRRKRQNISITCDLLNCIKSGSSGVGIPLAIWYSRLGVGSTICCLKDVLALTVLHRPFSICRRTRVSNNHHYLFVISISSKKTSYPHHGVFYNMQSTALANLETMDKLKTIVRNKSPTILAYGSLVLAQVNMQQPNPTGYQ